ncbi:snRNA-activating protein complex subunit 5-like [Microplitis mediator]|uniref:snRNA-activating protein complex subunit 5-like n=1 Tax=Microplitis mediator TaxID=375433 RepID=UPI0025540E85|nr:snRNA-activating protein complex subunit 5-like [Microplitis mediator]
MESQMKTLIEYRVELAEEEEWLKKLLTQMQDQIDLLQIEKLHLSQMVEKSKEKSASQNVNIKLSPDSRSKQLNLDVPNYIHSKHNVEEEEEEEDEEEED